MATPCHPDPLPQLPLALDSAIPRQRDGSVLHSPPPGPLCCLACRARLWAEGQGRRAGCVPVSRAELGMGFSDIQAFTEHCFTTAGTKRENRVTATRTEVSSRPGCCPGNQVGLTRLWAGRSHLTQAHALRQQRWRCKGRGQRVLPPWEARRGWLGQVWQVSSTHRRRPGHPYASGQPGQKQKQPGCGETSRDPQDGIRPTWWREAGAEAKEACSVHSMGRAG